MKSLAAAIAFCTRIPVPLQFGAEEVGRAASWFPLVGALLGSVSIAISWLLHSHLPPFVVAALILVAETLLTGALHMDGLADTADGFGGGRTKEDALRIMRDHAIGSYGGVALILMFLVKASALSAIVARTPCSLFLVLAPALGRWNVVLLSLCLPYARPNTAVSRHIGRRELLFASTITIILVGCAFHLTRWASIMGMGLAGLSALLFGVYCLRKIGGVTGDTLGTAEEIGECLVLLVGAWS